MTDYISTRQKSFIWENGKKEDFSFAYDGSPICVFDLPRECKKSVEYNIFESLKNGRIVCGKYQSKLKRFESARIIVFANFPPDKSTLSSDRWDILNIDGKSNIINYKQTLLELKQNSQDYIEEDQEDNYDGTEDLDI